MAVKGSQIYIGVTACMDLSEIEAELAEIERKESAIDGKIGQLLRDQHNVNDSLSSVFQISKQLTAVDSDVETLHDKLKDTAALSDKISKRVRHLDKVKTRVEAVIQRVEDILDLKNCTDGIKIALDNEDYEIAAGHIHRYRTLDTNFLKNNASESVSIEASIEILENAEQQMQKVARMKFENAYKEQDAQSIERFFKIFPLLGLQKEGLSKFVSFLSSQVASQTEQNLKMALEFVDRDEGSKVIFSDTFVLLFEGLARIVEMHQPLVETYYGPGWLTEFALLLQEECDRQSSLIFKNFKQKRRIEEKLEQVKLLGDSSEEIIDAKEIDSMLQETTLINERAELYLRFIKRRIIADVFLTCDTEDEKTTRSESIENALNNCGLSKILHELVGFYLRLETVFLNRSFHVAVQMNVVEEGSMTSSMVDDVFYVLKKCLRRTMSTTNSDAICAMINISNGLLENDYCKVLMEKLKNAIPSGYLDTVFTGRYQSEVVAQSRSVFLVSLNNCSESIQFLKTLVESLTTDWRGLTESNSNSNSTQKSRNAKSNAKVMSCIQDMHHIARSIDGVLQEGHHILVKYFLKPLVKACSENFALISHNLTEEGLVLNETEDPFSQKIIAPVDNFIGDIKDSLLERNFELMISNLSQTLVMSFEKVIFKMKFSRNGGLAFDREVRSLSNYLSSVTQWTVREKFTRLLQISTLLNLEQVEEVNELPIHSTSWKITPAEMRQILSLREDFRGEAIKRLTL